MYSRPKSTKATGFQIRLAWPVMTSLLMPQPPVPLCAGDPAASEKAQTGVALLEKLLTSWWMMPPLIVERRFGSQRCW